MMSRKSYGRVIWLRRGSTTIEKARQRIGAATALSLPRRLSHFPRHRSLPFPRRCHPHHHQYHQYRPCHRHPRKRLPRTHLSCCLPHCLRPIRRRCYLHRRPCSRHSTRQCRHQHCHRHQLHRLRRCHHLLGDARVEILLDTVATLTVCTPCIARLVRSRLQRNRALISMEFHPPGIDGFGIKRASRIHFVMEECGTTPRGNGSKPQDA